MVRKLLQFIIYIILWGKPSDKDFIKQSIGIYLRSKKYKKNWDHHLKNSSDFIYNSVSNLKTKNYSLAILGSGRLLDFPDNILVKKIYCVDKDPVSIFYYPNSKIKKSFLILYDITSSVDTWINKILNIRSTSLEEYLKLISEIHLSKSRNLSKNFFNCNLVISLNIISQLPIYWQDQVFRHLQKKFNINKDNENLILKALYPSSKFLVKKHLESLIHLSKKELILIGDLSYIEGYDLEFKFDNKKLIDTDSIKITSKLDKNVSLQDSLFGVQINTILDKMTSNKNILDEKSWIWKISEDKTKKTPSVYHRVFALFLSKVNS